MFVVESSFVTGLEFMGNITKNETTQNHRQGGFQGGSPPPDEEKDCVFCGSLRVSS